MLRSKAQWIWSLTLVQSQMVSGSIPGRTRNQYALLLAVLLHLTYRAGAVDDKDLAVNSDQGNA